MSDFTSLISTSAVRGAYRSSQQLQSDKTAATPEAEKSSFAEIVGNASKGTLQTVRESDAAMQEGVTGEMDTQAVVEATMNLESTVKVAVSVRDKLVEAYQEVMRMPI